jgi:hypothetical protein
MSNGIILNGNGAPRHVDELKRVLCRVGRSQWNVTIAFRKLHDAGPPPTTKIKLVIEFTDGTTVTVPNGAPFPRLERKRTWLRVERGTSRVKPGELLPSTAEPTSRAGGRSWSETETKPADCGYTIAQVSNDFLGGMSHTTVNKYAKISLLPVAPRGRPGRNPFRWTRAQLVKLLNSVIANSDGDQQSTARRALEKLAKTLN